MEIRDGLMYTESHEWVQTMEDGSVLIGLTDFAQSELGDLVFVNLPSEGDDVTAGESFADVESVKAVSDVYSPVTGKVTQVNADLIDKPEGINEEPYEAWLIRVDGVTAKEKLMNAAEYGDFLEK